MKGAEMLEVLVKVTTFATFCLILTSCLENPTGVEEVDLHSVEISCNSTEIPECDSVNNGKLIHIALIEGCDSYHQTWKIKSEASGTIHCEAGVCQMSVMLESYHFTPETVEEGTYDLLAYLDLDGDGEFDEDTEPMGCEEAIEYSGSDSTVIISNWY